MIVRMPEIKIHQFNWGWLCGSYSKGSGAPMCKGRSMWLRFGRSGKGVSFSNTPMLFSERYGYTKYFLLGFGWRFQFLGAV